ncbi:MAG: GTPase Era [Candidatus Latescibacteria bacterium]|nr:GTPase Era [Candidatus Latescibacterota bacterium]
MNNFRAGYVAILGRPNVGKSTLLNTLLNFKLSAVTKKPQTTRNKILGILSHENMQAIFIDTPGLLKPRYGLQKLMQKEIREAIETADLFLLVVEPYEPPTNDEIKLIEQIIKKPTILIINKVDEVEKERILPLIENYQQYSFKEIHPISALKNTGVQELKQSIFTNLPEGEPYYPTDQITERPEKFFVAELIRETVFKYYGEEIPYSTLVEIEEFKERDFGKNYIKAIIYVERANQRAIILGRGGQAIKRLGSIARENIEKFLDRPVFLELFVKVRENWRDDDHFIREKIYHH